MNIKILTIFLLSFFLSNYIHSIDITSVNELLKNNPQVSYFKCHNAKHFNYSPLPISKYPEKQPHQGLFDETFVLKIQEGIVASTYGFININNVSIFDLFPQNYPYSYHQYLIENTSFESPVRIQGKVAVITRIDYDCFGHWVHDVLGRLALLEISKIEYDWLYVPINKKYIRDTLALWGMDLSKVIDPHIIPCLQADELIVPSLSIRRIPENNVTFEPHSPLCAYFAEWAIDHMREKFLPILIERECKFSKKIFISRQDDITSRSMLNEDDVFSLFQDQGFERYCLSRMSLLDQMSLFYNADEIVAAHGSGLINIIYCKPNTKIIEIFQGRSDSIFCYTSQILKLDYKCIKTMEFEDMGGFQSTIVSLQTIENFIQKN